METQINLYQTERLQRNGDGSLTMIAANKVEAKEALAYVWSMGDGVEKMKEISQWDRGDILSQFKAKYPDADIGEVLEISEKNYKTAYRLLRTSEAWPLNYRLTDTVSHSVHAEIAMTKGLDALDMVTCLGISERLDLSTSKTRQLAKHVARAEDHGEELRKYEACDTIDDFDNLADENRTSRMRYVQVGDGFLEGFTTCPEYVPSRITIDLRSRTILDADGNPTQIPFNP